MTLRAMPRRLLTVALALGALLPVTACSDLQEQTAQRLARPAQMTELQEPQGQFVITSYYRVRTHGTTANVYIEGDGKAWLSKHEPSRNPTPTNPLALHLAAFDLSDNVIYLARPCQYAGLANGGDCPQVYWLGKKFSPETIASENAELDTYKARYNISGFNLIGYSGGGAMAILIAAQRHDILSIRTVAGELDTDLFSQIHKVSPLVGSENPKSVAASVANIPQHHYIGDRDKVVPRQIYDSFRAASGPSTCIRAGIVNNATHDEGWVNEWPGLLKSPLDCNSAE